MAYEKSEYTLKAPPIISTAFITPTYTSMAILELLLMYNWTTVYVITDMSSLPVFWSFGTEIPKLAASKAIIFYRRLARARDLLSFRDLLEDFRTLSRVMLFFGKADQLRRLVIEASSMNMTNGEFVYICDEPYAFYGVVTWHVSNVTEREARIAREAFRSVLVVSPFVEPFDESSIAIANMRRHFRQRAKDLYNITTTANQEPAVEILSSYATVFMLAQGAMKLRDGWHLSQRFLQRTFHAPGGLADLYIDKTGRRAVTLAVSHFSGNDSVREPFLVQSQQDTAVLLPLREISHSWPDGRWPPPNEPACGYSNQKAACLPHSDFMQNGGRTIVVTLASLLCAVIVMAACTRNYLYKAELRSAWSMWYLTEQLLLAAGSPPARTVQHRTRSFKGPIPGYAMVSSATSINS
ncbi:hypothetical protein BV898_14445 [Hypsibius exemplaris]|uniref:Receptor ligand binding region domain-containing protein n=1 Tax=Hypsibius exemplaris TaxID=2072580 RepID=A0A9X6RJK5_HYPEX|nr:hypothetical protein BV898_14445 [Hypsibius exemplaris]